ncbi:MAG: RNA polymerase sigma factor RpoE [Methylococcaceae bacterium]|nr:MAG: RNA polymerase sigma factor RpoE [Methylococcaceae bacterium]
MIRSAETSNTGDALDSELVARVQAGDKKAFDLLVLKYQHRIVQLVYRYIKDPVESQDVAQEAFIKAYRALPEFRGESAFFTWLYRIAINTAKNHLAMRNRRPGDDDDLDLDDAEQMATVGRLKNFETPERVLLSEELAEAILAAFDDLSEDLRTAISLRELDGMSYEKIAEVMQCPVGTVRSRIFRAREAIDQRLRPLLD